MLVPLMLGELLSKDSARSQSSAFGSGACSSMPILTKSDVAQIPRASLTQPRREKSFKANGDLHRILRGCALTGRGKKGSVDISFGDDAADGLLLHSIGYA